MAAQILNGIEIAKNIRLKIAADVIKRTKIGLPSPTLAVILVGNNPASHIYVRNKNIACNQVGIQVTNYTLPATTSHKELVQLITQLNHDDTIDGILVQLPLPPQIHTNDILELVHPNKDVDGFHPYNIGRLAQGHPHLKPCTPGGIMLLLEHTQQNLHGAKATVVGTSKIVGLPMALELITAGATVTTCNSKTRDLAAEVCNADILIVAIGKPELIQGSWIKPGSTVIDVGINRLENGSLTGDVEFAAAKQRAAWITPVPGGVGPMTITYILRNTLLAANLNKNCYPETL